ncbi:MAG: hypothetical protein ABS87_07930 [Sphingomonas sp. SCN 67-18]|uniref:hypothetical protein n=1 Tax=uncultured Sphingomonas sp. TaxID=158754 RepID=UPI0008693CED|nr:hypothetical protein [Sphingomonas sp. SCN 67-18]ODU21115.1 MAG: hypothetical protein ABS87_07930 [Sphingomonas sp. SCN 67-18]
MAKYTIKHVCGHEQVHNIDGREADRHAKRNWLDTTDCSDCYRAARDADLIRANEGLPTLTGSEKQVSWAMAIRVKLLPRLDAEKAALIEAAKSDDVRAIVHAKAARMRAMPSAQYWIDRETLRDFDGRLRRLVVAQLTKQQEAK